MAWYEHSWSDEEVAAAAADVQALLDANADSLSIASARGIRPDLTVVNRNLAASRTNDQIQIQADYAVAELMAEAADAIDGVDPGDFDSVRNAVTDAEVRFADWMHQRQLVVDEAHARGITPNIPVPVPVPVLENFVLALFDPDSTHITDADLFGEVGQLFGGAHPWGDVLSNHDVTQVRLEFGAHLAGEPILPSDEPLDPPIMDETEQGGVMAGGDATGWDETVDRLIAERLARRDAIDWGSTWDTVTGSLSYEPIAADELSDEELQAEVNDVATQLVQAVEPHRSVLTGWVTDQVRNQDRDRPLLREMKATPEVLEAMVGLRGGTGVGAYASLFVALLTSEYVASSDGATMIDPDPPDEGAKPDTAIMDEMEQGSVMAGAGGTWDKYLDRRIAARVALAVVGVATLFGIWILTTGDEETPPTTTLQAAPATDGPVEEPEPEPEPEPVPEPTGYSVTSDDGNVTLDVPAGVEPGITVAVLARENYPEALKAARENPGTVLYGVEAGDAVFASPIRFTRRLPAANFEGIPDQGIPLIVLVGHDGTGFEQLDDVEILRDGEDIYVSGLMTRPLTVVSVFEQSWLVPAGLDAATVIGTGSEVTIDALTAAGDPLLIASALNASVGSDTELITVTPVGPLLQLDCDAPGSGVIEASWMTTLPVEPADGELAVRAAATLVPEVKPDFTFRILTNHDCVEPPETITAAIDFIVDHPGGVVNAQGEAFGGGLSAILLMVETDSGIPDMRVGVFFDADGSGDVSAGDAMSTPQSMQAFNGTDLFIVPIFDFGEYIPYVLSGADFGELPDDAGMVGVQPGLSYLRDQYTGSGTFEEAIRIPVLGNVPFLGRVFAAEDTTSNESELIVFVTPHLIDPAS